MKTFIYLDALGLGYPKNPEFELNVRSAALTAHYVENMIISNQLWALETSSWSGLKGCVHLKIDEWVNITDWSIKSLKEWLGY